MRRRILATVLSAVLAISALAGCGGDGGSTTAADSGNDSATTAADSGNDSATTAADSGSDSAMVAPDGTALGWETATWNFGCSGTETGTWAEAGRKFAELMSEATGGKITVKVYASDQLTNGNQSEGIQAVQDGDPLQLSMHSNLIWSSFDARFNVVSLPYLFDTVENADTILDGTGGDALKEILSEYGVHCLGIGENGFRQLTNSVKEVKSVDDMKGLKIRVAGSNLLMKCYELWGANASNMNWSETYTSLQTKSVEGQENPIPTIDAASVQEVQQYCTQWNSTYDCLFFTINQELYNSLTDEQKAIVDECAQMAVEYQRKINRASDEEMLTKWETGGMTITRYEDCDIDSFKNAVSTVEEWFVGELQKDAGMTAEDAQALVDAFK